MKRYQAAKRDEDAVKLYEELYAAGQRNPVILNNMAWLLHQMGDHRALQFARDAYDTNPNRPEIADTYDWVLYNSGEKKKGLVVLQQAYLTFPSQMDIGYHVAVALEGLGRKAEALNIVQRLLKSEGQFEQREEAEALLKKLGG